VPFQTAAPDNPRRRRARSAVPVGPAGDEPLSPEPLTVADAISATLARVLEELGDELGVPE
jgi:hypothetical protein